MENADYKTMEELVRAKDAIWYSKLEDTYTYNQACDLLEALLPAKSRLLKEAA